MEPVSDRLRQTLLDLRLCRRADLRRCRRRVRRLADDLPAFDSVWIDALLQARRLTPFQARLLESGRAGELAVGPYVLLDRMGQGRAAATYVARVRDGRQRCVLKLMEPPLESIAPALENLRSLAERLEAPLHPQVVGPHAALRHADRLVAVSRLADGLRLSELLVRRGRFAPEVVLAIARQLVDGLAWLEEREVIHGDIRPTNVRLTPSGRAVLVDAGILPAVSPQLTIHAGLAPDRYDAIAPERIGTGQASTPRSDMYALGCLLWQLLAGRPPFPTGDPLAKLAAHQTRAVEDVREWAPDTPEPLADLLRKFTAREPADRPASFREIRERLRPARHIGLHRLARFHAEFSSAAGPRDAAGARRRWMAAAAVLSSAAILGVASLDQGVRGEVLAILPDRLQHWLEMERSAASGPRGHDDLPMAPDERGQPLPPVDVSGLMVLDSPGPYILGDTAHPDRLVLRGVAGVRPVLLVDRPVTLEAAQIMLDNVVIRSTRTALGASNPEPRLRIASHALQITDCWIDGDPVRTGAGPSPRDAAPPLIDWRALDEQAPGGGIRVHSSVFAGPSSGVRLTSAPSHVEVTNSLVLQARSLFDLSAELRPGRGLRLRLERTTLRGGEALFCWHVPRERSTPATAIAVDAVDCVFDLSGPRSALFQLIAPAISERLLRGIRVTGEGCVATPTLAEIALVAPDGRGFRRLDHDAIAIEGITTAPFEFAGPPSRRPADSAVRPGSITGPRLSSRTPGIDARIFPGAGAESAVAGSADTPTVEQEGLPF